ncbi:MAG: M56 family metallopeptidase [Chitinophagaceae bacterium]
MYLLFIKQIFSTELCQALCWTLLHSLWQGIALAIIAGIVLYCTKRSGASVRYNLFIGLFTLFITGTVATFIWQWTVYNSVQPAQGLVNGNIIPVQQPVPVQNAGMVIAERNTAAYYIDLFVGYFNEHAALLVTIWFLFFCMKCVKMISGLAHIQRLRHYKTYEPAAWWKNRVSELAAGIQIKKLVSLLESERVNVPLVIGFFKPVILVPLGLLAKLPQDELEAILLHELAHVKRRDYFVNLLQSFAETIFFFNPAVLWISSLIREEREHCCDDIAIAQISNPKQYINALMAFQEYNVAAGYAMAFPGKKNHLLNRIKRIINPGNNTSSSVEKAFFVTCFVIALILTWAFIQPEQEHIKQQTLNKQVADTVPLAKHYEPSAVVEGTSLKTEDKQTGKTGEVFLFKKNDTLFQFSTTESNVNWLRINGKEIAPRKIPAYYRRLDQLITEHNRSVAAADSKVEENTVITELTRQHFLDSDYEVVTENGKVVQLYYRKKEIDTDSLPFYQDIIRDVIVQASKKPYNDQSGYYSRDEQARQDGERDRIIQEYKQQQYQQPVYVSKYKDYQSQHKDYKAGSIDYQPKQLQLNAQVDADALQSAKLASLESLKQQRLLIDGERDRLAAEHKLQDDRLRQLGNGTSVRTGVVITHGSTTYSDADTTITPANKGPKPVEAEVIVAQLVKDKIIASNSESSLEYKLNFKEFIVNGVKMPESVHRKYREMFVKRPTWSYLYNWRFD